MKRPTMEDRLIPTRTRSSSQISGEASFLRNPARREFQIRTLQGLHTKEGLHSIPKTILPAEKV
jgi:hypothetical protein